MRLSATFVTAAFFGVALLSTAAESSTSKPPPNSLYCSIDPEHTMCKFRERGCPGDVLYSE